MSEESHPREKFHGIFALAAIGEAMLIACRGDKARIELIRKETCRYIGANFTLKALTAICEEAAENAEWTLPRETDELLPGRKRINQLIDELFGKEHE